MADIPFIMVAPTGARRGRQDHPALPISTSEIIETAQSCFAAGADALHLHIRDEQGQHSLDAGRYRETLAELAHAVPDMRVQVTTESAGVFSVEDQLSCLRDLQPGWASVSVREIARESELAASVYGICAENGTEVQHILYDRSDAALLNHWLDDGIVQPKQTSCILVMGRYGALDDAPVEDLGAFANALPKDARWMACAFGRNEHINLYSAAQLGGDLRVGFENSLCAPDGTPWPDNETSVRALVHTLSNETPNFDIACE